jgi:hypothetical protein
MLKKHFTTLQVPDTGKEPRYVMNDRNRARLAKMLVRVRQLRGQ